MAAVWLQLLLLLISLNLFPPFVKRQHEHLGTVPEERVTAAGYYHRVQWVLNKCSLTSLLPK